MKLLHGIAFILVIIGALNWLCVGLFSWDISHLFGGMEVMVSRIIYILVGLSGLWLVFNHKGDCKWCGAGQPMPKP